VTNFKVSGGRALGMRVDSIRKSAGDESHPALGLAWANCVNTRYLHDA
jgi:hypothetical protein